MSAQFIIGRAGSGKTTWCMSRTFAACRADALGSPILWLVPRQATFQIERDLCGGSDLGGFFRVRVVSFELLCGEVLKEVGGAAAPDVTHCGRQIILGHLLRRHRADLKFFGSVACHAGLATELDATLDELERGGADLASIAGKLPGSGNTALREKAHDLQLIHRAYNDFLGQQRLDPGRRLQQAMESFERSPLLRAATIYVDGFLHFTHRQRRLLTALAAVCPAIHITLMMDPASAVLKDVHHQPDDLSLFHRMETEYGKLWFALQQTAIKVQTPILLTESHRFKSPALCDIEKWSNPSSAGAHGLELIELPDKRAEVSAAARRVGDWVAGGLRYRDIAVLARQLGDYHDLISATFAEHGIPFFLDARRTAAHHPLIQFIRAALAIAGEPWAGQAMITLIKCGLCGLSAEQADALENHLLLHGGDGGFWTTPTAWAELSDPIARLVEPLCAYMDAVAASGSTRQLSAAVLLLAERFSIRPTLSKWIAAASPEQAAEHRQVWAQVCDLFQQLVDLLGDRPMPLAEFQAILENALEKFEFAIAPATVDQVLVGQVDRTRTPAVNTAIILGLSDGQFPLAPAAPTILTDDDRRHLSRMIDLEPDVQRRSLDEEMLGYFAFTRASSRLIVSRPLADDAARELGPGSLWRKLRSLVPAAQPPATEAADISTPRQLIAGLMQWTRSATHDSELWPPLYQWLANRPSTPDAINQMRLLAWPALSYANSAELSAQVSGQLFPSPLRATARQLESFAACPFQHFARYGLKLAARVEEAVGDGDLWRICQQILTDRLDWARVTETELNEQLGPLAIEVATHLKGQQMLSVARNRHMLKRVESMVNQTIAAQRAAAQRGAFQPALMRARFDEGAPLPVLHIGEHLLIHGQIDRIDVSADNKSAVLYDYRLSVDALNLADVYHGLSLKLPVHLLAWQQRDKSRAAAALALAVLRPIRDQTPQNAPSPGEEKFDLLEKPRGIIDEKFAGDLDSKLQPGSESELLNAYLKQDSTFGKRTSSDIATSDEFAALLDHVRKTLADIARKILAGVIRVKPYRMGNKSPCAACGFRDVCRFVPEEGYAFLQPMKRAEVLDALVKEQR